MNANVNLASIAVAAAARRRALGCVMAALALAPAPARAETLKAQYLLSLIGFSIGHASAAGVIEPHNYHVDIAMKTTGLATLVTNTSGAATASGALSTAGPAPSNYANTMSNTHESRTVRMALDANAVRAVEVKPVPWDLAVRVPVSEENKHNIVDPVSALIMSVPQSQSLTGPAACNRTIPVFDGLTRFNVSLFYVETKSVRTRGYTGPVMVCGARYTPISGHRLDSSSTKYLAENSEMDVWLAPLPGAHVVVPYRIAIKTSAGMLIIEAAEFQIGQRQTSRRDNKALSAE
ncbi:MAG: DUF3108 domain-containing protein [Methylocystis sp.]|nr:DUF3108 domain-containing protein [Methylocystis sp.]